MKHIIVAHDQNGVIGRENDIPWTGQQRADMQRFKAVTLGHAVIMGRLTYESIGKPLPGRENVVVSRQHTLDIPGCTVVNTIEEAFEVTKNHDETYVIGGSKIYELAMPYVDILDVTEIEAEFEGDTFFVEIDPEEWELVSEESHAADVKNVHAYSFKQYRRKLT